MALKKYCLDGNTFKLSIFFVLGEIDSQYVVQAGVKLVMIHLPQPPRLAS